MYETDFAALKQRCVAEMAYHDRADHDQRMMNYSGKGVTDFLDPAWNRQHRAAPKPRYTLSPAQLRRMQIS